MALSTDDVNAVQALWGEWVADTGFRLELEVRDEELPAEMTDGALGARLTPSLYLQVRIWHRAILVFDERCPYGREALQASVSALARCVAEHGDSV